MESWCRAGPEDGAGSSWNMSTQKERSTEEQHKHSPLPNHHGRNSDRAGANNAAARRAGPHLQPRSHRLRRRRLQSGVPFVRGGGRFHDRRGGTREVRSCDF